MMYDHQKDKMVKFNPGTYDVDVQKPKEPEVHKFPSSEITKQMLPCIEMQQIDLKIIDENTNELRLVTHYFFMSNKLEVELVRPDYSSKSRRFEIIN
jgi:hypothetical protein